MQYTTSTEFERFRGRTGKNGESDVGFGFFVNPVTD